MSGIVTGPGGVPMRPEGYTEPDPIIPEGYEGGIVKLNGVRGLRLTKPGLREKCACLNIHGGGFTLGGIGEIGMLTPFLEATRMEVFSVDYGLAPANPYPASVNDCIAFYKGMLEMGYERIVVGGGSAGAALTLSLALALKDQGIQLPVCLWCSSPIDDILFSTKELYREDFISRVFPEVFKVYAPGANPEDPYLSPIYGNFRGLPPMIIQAGGEESLSASALRLVAKAVAADVEVAFHYAKGMGHCYADPNGAFPEAVNGFNEITAFVNNVLDLDEE